MGSGWIPNVQRLLDVSLNRPPYPLPLKSKRNAVWDRGVNGFVRITGLGRTSALVSAVR